MEVELISKTSILPSSPTPSHLKTYKFSLLDQFGAPTYFSTILFYKNLPQTTNQERSVLFKKSLSETLSQFYPLAGRIKDQFSVDCNDEGACYIEANSNIPLSEYLSNPDLSSLVKLLPNWSQGSELVLVQETSFRCGCFSIGISVSHLVSDIASLFSFLKHWAATTTHNSPTSHPFLEAESIFPQYPEFPNQAKVVNTIYSPFLKPGENVTKRVVFSESAISKLKEKLSLENINNPTRVEVVTALLSKCLIASLKNKPLAINHAVNFRKKMDPPLPECSLGNFVGTVGTVFTNEGEELSELVSQLREAMKKIDKEFIKNVKCPEKGFFKYYDLLKEIREVYGNPEEVEFGGFTSWCNFGVYDIDFGWGKPIWVVGNMPYANVSDYPMFNLICLMDTKVGYGVEAWLTVKQQTFDVLSKHSQLLQYASIDPLPFYD